MSPDWNPPIDVSQFGGSESELQRFHEQRFARRALEGFAEHGRGVLMVHIDRTAQTLRDVYITMATDDGSEAARQVRALVESYDPARQAVLCYRDAARGRDVAGIVEIEPHH